MNRIFSILIGIITPILIYFDMIDTILIFAIAIYYGLMLIINLLGSAVLSALIWSKDNNLRDTIQGRLNLEMAEDVNYNYRMSALVIFEAVTLYMIWPLSLPIAIIIGLCMTSQLLNIYLVKVGNENLKGK